jgi:hypothetical protein
MTKNVEDVSKYHLFGVKHFKTKKKVGNNVTNINRNTNIYFSVIMVKVKTFFFKSNLYYVHSCVMQLFLDLYCELIMTLYWTRKVLHGR